MSMVSLTMVLLEGVCRRHGVAALYQFGPHARSTLGVRQDVDFGVLFDAAPPESIEMQLVAFGNNLASVLGRRMTIMALDHAPRGLVRDLLLDGRLMVNRNASRRVAFEVAAQNAESAAPEQFERLARVAAKATELWRSDQEMREFLTTPHPALDGRTPVDLSMTELGARRVEVLLARIAGFPSSPKAPA